MPDYDRLLASRPTLKKKGTCFTLMNYQSYYLLLVVFRLGLSPVGGASEYRLTRSQLSNRIKPLGRLTKPMLSESKLKARSNKHQPV